MDRRTTNPPSAAMMADFEFGQVPMLKRITYRIHAESAILERKLDKHWIERVVRNPE
jgi:hypothetical protein